MIYWPRFFALNLYRRVCNGRQENLVIVFKCTHSFAHRVTTHNVILLQGPTHNVILLQGPTHNVILLQGPTHNVILLQGPIHNVILLQWSNSRALSLTAIASLPIVSSVVSVFSSIKWENYKQNATWLHSQSQSDRLALKLIYLYY